MIIFARMKVKILYIDEFENQEYVDGVIDENKINGYFHTRENVEDDSVNVFFDGQTLTLKRDFVLMDYLAG